MTGQIRAGNRYGIYMTLSVCRSVRALSVNKDEEKKRFFFRSRTMQDTLLPKKKIEQV